MTQRGYEGLFLVESSRASSQWNETVAHIKELLEKHGASVRKLVKWDDRKLAYEIAGHRRGTYVLGYFDSDTQALTGMRRDLAISETVLRHTLVRHEGEMLESPADLFADGAGAQERPAAASSAAEDAKTAADAPAPISPAPASAKAASTSAEDSGSSEAAPAPATAASTDAEDSGSSEAAPTPEKASDADAAPAEEKADAGAPAPAEEETG